jgi:SAM-dependent methyltransferase
LLERGGGQARSPGQGFDDYSENYDEVLNRGLRLSGEDSRFFARERVRWLAKCLRELGESPRSILDFGCGKGSTAAILLDLLGAESVVGIEESPAVLRAARREAGPRARFLSRGEFVPTEDLDLVFCNGVFHHVAPERRSAEMEFVHRALRPGGLFSLWENNPWNPATRLVMSRVAFDAEAIALPPPETRKRVREAGFVILRCDFLFIFPRFLKALRGLEPFVAKLPIGTQYQVLCRKEGRR